MKNTDKPYFTPHQEHFSELLAEILGQEAAIPAFVNVPCFEGLSNIEIEIVIAKYIWSMEDFLDMLDEVFEAYCKYNFNNSEEIPQYEKDDDEENYEL